MEKNREKHFQATEFLLFHFSTFRAFRPLKQKCFVLFSSAALQEAGRNDEWASGLALGATLATQ